MQPRDRYHHGDLRRELVERATEAIRESGDHRFSLRAAARAAGVDVAAAYRHFANKDALLKAVAAEAFAALARAMEREQRGAETALARLRAIGRAYVGFAIEEPALFRMAFGPYGAGGHGMDVRGAGARGRDPYEMLLDALRGLLDEGDLGVSIDDAAVTAWSAVHGLAHLTVEGNLTGNRARAAVSGVIEHVLRGLRAEERTRPDR